MGQVRGNGRSVQFVEHLDELAGEHFFRVFLNGMIFHQFGNTLLLQLLNFLLSRTCSAKVKGCMTDCGEVDCRPCCDTFWPRISAFIFELSF